MARFAAFHKDLSAKKDKAENTAWVAPWPTAVVESLNVCSSVGGWYVKGVDRRLNVGMVEAKSGAICIGKAERQSANLRRMTAVCGERAGGGSPPLVNFKNHIGQKVISR